MLTLQELVDHRFEQLLSFPLAAQSPQFQRGRDDYKEQLRKAEVLMVSAAEHYRQCKLGATPLRPLDEQNTVLEARTLLQEMDTISRDDKVVITGPFNAELITELWGASKYFLDHAHDFRKERGAVKDILISCNLSAGKQQVVAYGNRQLSSYGITIETPTFQLHIDNCAA